MFKPGKHNIVHYVITAVVYFVQSLVSSIIWLFLFGVGYYVWKKLGSPLNLLVGIPLMLVGGGSVINDLANSYLSIFSPKYNQQMCIFCRKEGIIEEIKN